MKNSQTPKQPKLKRNPELNRSSSSGSSGEQRKRPLYDKLTLTGELMNAEVGQPPVGQPKEGQPVVEWRGGDDLLVVVHHQHLARLIFVPRSCLYAELLKRVTEFLGLGSAIYHYQWKFKHLWIELDCDREWDNCLWIHQKEESVEQRGISQHQPSLGSSCKKRPKLLM